MGGLSGLGGLGGVPAIFQSGGATESDWWDPDGEGLCVWAAYQPKGAASLADSYTDLSGNGNNCAPGVAPTWDAVNGWKFNGSTQYLTTTFQPAADQSQSMLMQYTNCTIQHARTWAGCYGGSTGFQLQIFGANHRYYNMGNRDGSAVLAAANTGVAGAYGYFNGASDTIAIGGGAAPGVALYIAANNLGGAIQFGLFYGQAFVIYDCTLTAAQMLAVATAMAAL